jgi:O-antigen ligase
MKVKLVNDLRGLIFVITLIYSLLFFSILAILEKEYTGESGDLSFIIFNILFVALSFIFVFGERLFIKTEPLRRINLLFYLLPLITCIIYLIESPTHENAYRYFTVYIGFSFPSIYIGTYVATNKALKSMAKWWDLVLIIICLALILTFPKIVFSREVMLGGGLEYQGISYLAAFAYSLSLFSILFGDSYPRFRLCKSKIFIAVTYLLMLFQIICVFVTGGRGGFVLVFMASLMLLYLKFKKSIKYAKVILVAITIVLSLILFSNILPQEVDALMQRGTGRIFSYITFEGIDFSETSGRDIYYAKAIKLIEERPMLGYGIFKYVDTSDDYPHNIFLEILLQGGILYLLLWIILLVILLLKFKRILKVDDINLLLIPIALYPFTELLFSGSYLMTPLFWFIIAYVFSFKIQKTSLRLT